MFVGCRVCKYDSGDFDSTEKIAEKVNADGGRMTRDVDPETGKKRGWEISCPQGHSGRDISLD